MDSIKNISKVNPFGALTVTISKVSFFEVKSMKKVKDSSVKVTISEVKSEIYCFCDPEARATRNCNGQNEESGPGFGFKNPGPKKSGTV